MPCGSDHQQPLVRGLGRHRLTEQRDVDFRLIGQRHHERARRQRRVGDGEPLATAAKVSQRGISHPARRGDNLFQLGMGDLIDLIDRRARQDIVELVEQQDFPRRLDFVLGIVKPVQGGDGAERFRFQQAVFGGAVERLDLGLGGQRATMQLHIELASPARQAFFR